MKCKSLFSHDRNARTTNLLPLFMTFWDRFNNLGIIQHLARPAARGRHAILSNRIAWLTFLLCNVLGSAHALIFSWDITATTLGTIGVLSLFTIALNAAGYTRLSRLWLCLLIPAGLLMLSIIYKLAQPDMPASTYFNFRFVLFASSVLPFMVCTPQERKLLITCLAEGLLCLLLYDVLHHAFGVNYDHANFSDTTYYYTNVVICFAYVAMHVVIYMIKRSPENTLGTDAPSVELPVATRPSFVPSSSGTDQQQLIRTNQELVKHNHELQQFSYAVSHNLRGSVASLLGLINLIDRAGLDSQNDQVFDHISDAALRLDAIIKDLGKIIDIRHDIFRIRQRVDLQHEIGEIKKLFREKLLVSDIVIREELQTTDLYSVKPMLHSILYNLISNGIKYRSDERRPEILISSSENLEYYILKVTDNGLGIDLKQHSQDLFRLYKRFHNHTEGRGLGLYLVKLQCEALGGTIDLTSELNQYTTFTVYLKKPENVTKQVLYSEPHARIFYDAELNATGVIWQEAAEPAAYRKVISKCIELLKVYQSSNWIFDASFHAQHDLENARWFIEEALPLAARNGLQRIGRITPDKVVTPYTAYTEEHAAYASLEIQHSVFTKPEHVSSWLRHEHEKSIISNFPSA